MSAPAVHPLAVIDARARLGEDVEVGPFAVIEGDVEIATGCRIGPHAVIYAGSRLARGVQVFQGASVGNLPQDLKFAGERTTLTVGAGTVIREFATLSRGTVEAGTTAIGSGCLIMAYVHVAHDCRIGDGCILANAVQVAGHVKIGRQVIVGGLVAVHQFVQIGDHAFIGGGMEVSKDVPPFVLANGSPLRYTGLNTVGLRRRGFDSERILKLKRFYRLFYGRGSGNTSQALAALQPDAARDEDARLIHDFAAASQRGLIGG
jgi:UDP-N-acetylglucosamine acyltransferase